MRVRSREVEYMTPEWKTAIRMERKYTKKFGKDPSQENLINKNKWRNTATKLRRRAIKDTGKLRRTHPAAILGISLRCLSFFLTLRYGELTTTL